MIYIVKFFNINRGKQKEIRMSTNSKHSDNESEQLFQPKGDGNFSITIYSAEETQNDKPFTLMCYGEDIRSLVEALTGDQEFMDIINSKLSPLSPEEIQRIVELVICHECRLTTRKYGLGHT